MSSGNGKAGTLRERIAHNQAERERSIADLEGSEWSDEDERTSPQIILEAMKAGAEIAAEATGKHRAMKPDQADEITLTDNGTAPKQSDPPPSKVSPLAIAWLGVRKMPPWGVVFVALAAIAAYVFLKR